MHIHAIEGFILEKRNQRIFKPHLKNVLKMHTGTTNYGHWGRQEQGRNMTYIIFINSGM